MTSSTTCALSGMPFADGNTIYACGQGLDSVISNIEKEHFLVLGTIPIDSLDIDSFSWCQIVASSLERLQRVPYHRIFYHVQIVTVSCERQLQF